MKRVRDPEGTRQRLLDAARDRILAQGFAATGVGDICRDAAVTKGAFFHHFASKDELGRAALQQWADFGGAMYARAADPKLAPVDRVHRFFDIMIDMVREATGPITCVIGIVAQEQAVANPMLRAACGEHLHAWTDQLADLLRDAKAAADPVVDFDPDDLAWFANALWQGSMLVAKACEDPELIIRNLERGRAHVMGHFPPSRRTRRAATGRSRPTRARGHARRLERKDDP